MRNHLELELLLAPRVFNRQLQTAILGTASG